MTAGLPKVRPAPAQDTEEIQDAGHVDVLIGGAGISGIGAAQHLPDQFPTGPSPTSTRSSTSTTSTSTSATSTGSPRRAGPPRTAGGPSRSPGVTPDSSCGSPPASCGCARTTTTTPSPTGPGGRAWTASRAWSCTPAVARGPRPGGQARCRDRLRCHGRDADPRDRREGGARDDAAALPHLLLRSPNDARARRNAGHLDLPGEWTHDDLSVANWDTAANA